MINKKTVLVIGGCGGIGKVIVDMLSANYQVVVVDIAKECAHAEKDGNIEFFRRDITKEEDILSFDEIVGKKDLAGVVFASGIMIPGSVTELDYQDYLRTMNINLNSVYRCCRQLIPHFLKKKAGHIIVLASHLGVVGSYNLTAYSLSKAALIELVKCLALDYGDQGIQANCISPAFVDTDILNKAMKDFSTSKKWMFATGGLPRQRVEAEDIAKAVKILLEMKSINGSNIVIDGGYTAR